MIRMSKRIPRKEGLYYHSSEKGSVTSVPNGLKVGIVEDGRFYCGEWSSSLEKMGGYFARVECNQFFFEPEFARRSK